MFEPDESSIRVSVRVEGGRITPYYPWGLPELREGCICELVIPAQAFRNDDEREWHLGQRTYQMFPPGTSLFVQVRPAADKAHLARSGSQDVRGLGSYVEIVVQKRASAELTPGDEDGLCITFRGGKKSVLSACEILIPFLNQTATSLNHAYTMISQHLETDRKSHTGNVFDRVFYLEPQRRVAIPLKIRREQLQLEFDTWFEHERLSTPLKSNASDKEFLEAVEEFAIHLKKLQASGG